MMLKGQKALNIRLGKSIAIPPKGVSVVPSPAGDETPG
jgi:hypothetical protein